MNWHWTLALFLLGIIGMGLPAPHSSTQDIEVEDLAFTDGTHGWVLAREPMPQIFRTLDGGKSWSRILLPPTVGFYRLAFYDERTGIAAQMEWEKALKIYRSEDGGETWTLENVFDLPHDESVLSMTMTSREDAILVGEGELGRAFVIQLSDKGKTLRVRQDLPADLSAQSNALDVFGDGAGHLWIVGKELILHSADNGRTWENQFLNSVPRIDMAMSGTALPGGHAWMAVADFEVYKTDDYGKHWIRSLDTSDRGYVNFESVALQDPLHGCAVGSSSYVYCTEDGGETWSSSRQFPAYLNGSPFFSKLLVFHSGQGWASIGGGLYKTEDGGKSFREVLTSSVPPESGIPGETQARRTPINGPTELAWDSNGFLFIVESEQGRLLRLDLKHASIQSMLPEPQAPVDTQFDVPNAIAADQNGALYIADFDGRLRQMNVISGATRTLLPSPPEGSKRLLEAPAELAVDGHGEPLVVDRHNKVFRWNRSLDTLETVAGTGSMGFAGDGGPATAASFQSPEGVALDSAGNIFVSDYSHCRIRKIVAKTGIITTVAGTGECASEGDGGPATQAAINYPGSVAVDRSGNIYFVEGGTNKVRRIDPQGGISTYAGNGEMGFSGDGGPASKAALGNPAGITLDSTGNLYISEYVNNRIRRVDAVTHIISTIAGNGKPRRIDVEM